jgi:two-component system response regulator QseB
MSGRILVADDDAILRDFIAQGLREQGFLVREAATLEQTLDLARTERFDLWVLDRRMPGGDAIEALRTLRGEGLATPALFLSASRTTQQRIEGLEAGADDYLSKPFSIDELTARVRALLRRPSQMSAETLKRGAIELRIDARRVFVHGAEVPVTANEWRLLVLLAQRPTAVFSRAQIIAEAGIAEDAGEAAVDHLVSRLRQKLRGAGAGENAIRTARGLGFGWGD